MELFWKATALSLIACILALTINREKKEFSLFVSVAACLMVIAVTVTYLKPIFLFLKKLEILGDLYGDMLAILIKSLGVGLISEIAAMLCADAGNTSLAKAIQLLSSTAILYLSLPMLSVLMDLIQKIVGEL